MKNVKCNKHWYTVWRDGVKIKLSICNRCHQPKPTKEKRILRTVEEVKLLYKNQRFTKKYSITLDDYKQILEKQNGVCGVCKQSEPSGRMLAVDHDHETGKVRGLLCTRCNILLGYCKDDINILKNAIKYLQKYDVIK